MPPTPPVTDETLATIGHRIHNSFGSLESDTRSSADDASFFLVLSNESQRFSLWAKNLGLYGLGHSSLDYRFRDAPVVYQYTRHLLGNLEDSVSAIQQDLSRQGTGRELSVSQPDTPENAFDQGAGLDENNVDATASDESSEDEEALMSYQEDPISTALLENARLIIDRPYKLSFKIRNPVTRLGFSKARGYRAIDVETGVDVMRRYAYYDLRHVAEIMARYQQISPVECENHDLVQRLARANTNRRRQLNQWRRHQMKLNRVDNIFESENKRRHSTEAAPSDYTRPRNAKEGARSLPTTATKLDENNIDLNDNASAISTSTYAFIFTEDNDKGVSIPPLPEKLRTCNEFECPFCHILCSRHIASKTPWERHVFKDLRPYVCTYEDCAEIDQQYDNFKDWVNHEVNVHRHGIAQPSSPSQEPSEECHSTLGLPNGSLQSHSTVAPNEISRQECPICLEKNPTFYHIGLHLRRFAVFALPNSVGTDEDIVSGDQGSNIADVNEEFSVSSQSISSWLGKESIDENDEDGELHKRNRSTFETREGVNLSEHALREFDGAFDESDMERYLAGLASENTSLYREESTSAESASNIHQPVSAQNMSFYVVIDRLEPNYQAQPAQRGSHGYWFPPTIRTGYTTRGRSVFHWKGGTISHIAAHEEVGHTLGQMFSVATVFTQHPDTPYLVVIPFDARRGDVAGYPGGWRPLTFRHVRIGNTQHTYSSVSANGDYQHIAARGSSRWMPQLLPGVYDDQSRSTRIQAGLIGSIPILIALAAFSAPISFLPSVLTNCLRLQRWHPHQYQYPAGHTAERGMVVTVFLDPENPQGSNPDALNGLENGRLGPFYSYPHGALLDEGHLWKPSDNLVVFGSEDVYSVLVMFLVHSLLLYNLNDPWKRLAQ